MRNLRLPGAAVFAAILCACGGGGGGSPAPVPSGNPAPSSSPTSSPTTGPTATPTVSPTNNPTSTPTAPPTPTPTPAATPLLIHIGFQYGEFTDPKYGAVYFYTAHSHAEVIQATHGQTAQFLNDDMFGTMHTASGLGTSFPKNFDNQNGKAQAGSVLDGGTTWSTGSLNPGTKSQVFTIGPPGTYYFGCAYHYSVPPNPNNSSMGDVLVSN